MLVFSKSIVFNFKVAILCMQQESNHNENIPKSESTCTCMNLRNKTSQYNRRTLYQSSGYMCTCGSVCEVSTESITIVHLGCKYNFESPNQMQLIFTVHNDSNSQRISSRKMGQRNCESRKAIQNAGDILCR